MRLAMRLAMRLMMEDSSRFYEIHKSLRKGYIIWRLGSISDKEPCGIQFQFLLKKRFGLFLSVLFAGPASFLSMKFLLDARPSRLFGFLIPIQAIALTLAIPLSPLLIRSLATCANFPGVAAGRYFPKP